MFFFAERGVSGDLEKGVNIPAVYRSACPVAAVVVVDFFLMCAEMSAFHVRLPERRFFGCLHIKEIYLITV